MKKIVNKATKPAGGLNRAKRPKEARRARRPAAQMANHRRAGQMLDPKAPSASDLDLQVKSISVVDRRPAHVCFNNGRTESANKRFWGLAQKGLRGAGRALPYFEKIQSSFEPHQLDCVRAFMGPEARQANRELAADAYASGERVAFRTSTPTLHVVAHEVAHVVQQRAGAQLANGVGSPGDSHERQADAVAQEVVAGRSAVGKLQRYTPTPSGVQRQPREDRTAIQFTLTHELSPDYLDSSSPVAKAQAIVRECQSAFDFDVE